MNFQYFDTILNWVNGTTAKLSKTIRTQPAESKSSSIVTFDLPANHGTPTKPITGNITYDFTQAVIGQVVVMCHNDSVEPTLPTSVILAGTYTTDVDNYITFHYFSPGVVLVTYSQV